MRKFLFVLVTFFLAGFTKLYSSDQHIICGWDYGNGKVMYCSMGYMMNLASYTDAVFQNKQAKALFVNMVKKNSYVTNPVVAFFTVGGDYQNETNADSLIAILARSGITGVKVTSSMIDTPAEIDNYDVIVMGGSGSYIGENAAGYIGVQAVIKDFVQNNHGGLLFCGWAVYTVNGLGTTDYMDLLPVESVPDYAYGFAPYNLLKHLPDDPLFYGIGTIAISDGYYEYPPNGLKAGATAYAGITAYSPDIAPGVTTTAITVYDGSSATMGGNVIDQGSSAVTERGVVFSTSDHTPTIGEAGVTQDANGSGTGIFSESIAGLVANTTYYVRAYATNSVGTTYGDVQTFLSPVIEIGNGTVTCNYPYTTYWMGGRTQLLYTAAQLAAGGATAGSITSIGFNVTSYSSQTMNNFNIRLGNTTDATLTEWVTSGMTYCYSTNYAVSGTGWQMINLQIPFVYTGNNLILEICYGDNGSYSSYSYVKGTTAPAGQIRPYWMDNTVGCSFTGSSYTGYTGLPNLRITEEPITCLNPSTAGTISGTQTICSGQVPAGIISTTLPVGAVGNLQYKWQSSTTDAVSGFSDIAPAQNSATYSPAALSATTWYKRLAKTDCESTWLESNVEQVTVNPLPVPTISGLTSVCAGTTSVIYTTEASMTGYTWTLSAGGIITAGGGSNSISVTWNTAGPQTVSVNYTNANSCTATSATVKNVTVNPLPVPTVTGLASACAGSTGVTYTTEALMTGYSWSISAGGTITAGSTTNSITVTWNTAGPQTISVNYTNGNSCTATSATVKNITINPLPVPTVTGLTAVCAGTNGVTYTTEASMTGYSWVVSAGGTIMAGSGTNSILVSWNTAGPQTVNVNYTNGNSCTASSPTVKNVTVNPLPVPTISGLPSVCEGTTALTYSTEALMTGYNWTISAGGTITAGAGTNAITVAWNTAGPQTVSVNYTNENSCTAASATIKNVTVNPLPVPTITGLSTLCAGTTGVTYTTEAGMTDYTWTVSPGGTITAGTGTNTINVTWNTAGPQNVSVNYINGNSCTAVLPSVKNITVNALPVPTVSGTASVCVGTTGLSYTTESSMTDYTWTVSPGGTITAGAGTNTITVTWSTVGSKTITVNYLNDNGCTATLAGSQSVTVLPLPVPIITGQTVACAGSTGISYSTEASMTGYTWDISSGGFITSGTGTNTILVSWNTPGPQTVSVNYTTAGGCQAGAPTITNITVNPAPVPTITGPAELCAGTSNVTYSTEAGFSEYMWITSYGGVITSGANTSVITVDWSTAGQRSISVNYKNNTGCSALQPSTQNVNVLSVPVPVISGSAELCQGTTGSVYTTQPNNSDYIWMVSPGGTITAGAGTNSITVAWNGSGSQMVSVSYTNALGCGAPVPADFIVNVTPKPAAAGAISGANSLCQGTAAVVYTVPSIANTTSYVWAIPSGASIVSGANTNSITVNFSANAQSGTFTVHGENSCGTGSSSLFQVALNPVPAKPDITHSGNVLSSSAAYGNQWYFNSTLIPGATAQTYEAVYNGDYSAEVTLNDCSSPMSDVVTMLITSIADPALGMNVNMYPNPNHGRFTITIQSGILKVFDLKIINNLGAVVYQKNGLSVDGTLNEVVEMEDMAKGVYMVILICDDKQIVRKMVTD